MRSLPGIVIVMVGWQANEFLSKPTEQAGPGGNKGRARRCDLQQEKKRGGILNERDREEQSTPGIRRDGRERRREERCRSLTLE